MNSVMEIGDKILFLSDGLTCWEGTREEILRSDNKVLNDFVFASELMKKFK
jgi:phospholipid/cholesterol/gamma-HCH transport system ATP-binding protein